MTTQPLLIIEILNLQDICKKELNFLYDEKNLKGFNACFAVCS